MQERVSYRVCRDCGQSIVFLTTKRGKRIGVNVDPRGHEAFKFRSPTRHETRFIYGTHQPHFLTCVKRQKQEHPRHGATT